MSAKPDVWKKSNRLMNVSSPPDSSMSLLTSWGTKNMYSHTLDSKVSDGFEVKEQKLVNGLHAMGSWNPHVPFRYFGWKKPVKFVLMPLIDEVWSALKRFCQFVARDMYFVV